MTIVSQWKVRNCQ